MRNKFAYSYSVKIYALGFNELLESIFCLLLVMEAFSLQNVFQMLEEVIVGWREVRWIWQTRQNFVALFIRLLKSWLCHMQSAVAMEKKWAQPVDQYWLQVLQFSVHLINLLSLLLRCNGFAGIQKAVVDQTGSRPPNSDHDMFLVKVWLWEVLWNFLLHPLSWSSPIVVKIHVSSHVTIKKWYIVVW